MHPWLGRNDQPPRALRPPRAPRLQSCRRVPLSQDGFQATDTVLEKKWTLNLRLQQKVLQLEKEVTRYPWLQGAGRPATAAGGRPRRAQGDGCVAREVLEWPSTVGRGGGYPP